MEKIRNSHIENFNDRIKNKNLLFIGIVTVILSSLITFSISGTIIQVNAQKENLTKTINEEFSSLSELFKKVEKSVVQISIDDDNAFGGRLGSGFIYDNNGHVITNNHVIDNANKIHVTFSDGTIYEAKIIGTDEFSDLAVLKLMDVPNEKIVPLILGNSNEITVGQRVAAVGNPFGLSGTLTEGIVSGLGRLLPTSDSDPSKFNEPSFSIPNVIQTDAAINPGNSGGPLLTMNGEVIGINSAIFSSTGVYSGIGFAIPSNTVKKVASSLIDKGTYQHPWIGITGIDVNPEIAEKMNLTEPKGFLVVDVNAGGPADKAGIMGGDKIYDTGTTKLELGGDVIVGIDDKNVRKIDDILSYLENEKEVGQNITLTVIRNGNMQNMSLTLEPRPDKHSQQTYPTLGVTGLDVTPEIADKMKLKEAKGFLVVDVNSGGPADKAGIVGGYKTITVNDTKIRIGGDVIVSLDNTTVSGIKDIKNYLKTKNAGDKISVGLIRDNKPTKVSLVLSKDIMPDSNLEDKDGKNPFENNNPFGFNDPYDLKEECIRNFGEDVCRYLFR